MILTRERRMEQMQALGDVSLYMHAPFDWRVRHVGVLIVEDDDDIVPEGQGNNPYAAPDDHWRQLTELEPLIHVLDGDRFVRWSPGTGWVEIVKHHRQAE